MNSRVVICVIFIVFFCIGYRCGCGCGCGWLILCEVTVLFHCACPPSDGVAPVGVCSRVCVGGRDRAAAARLGTRVGGRGVLMHGHEDGVLQMHVREQDGAVLERGSALRAEISGGGMMLGLMRMEQGTREKVKVAVWTDEWGGG